MKSQCGTRPGYRSERDAKQEGLIILVSASARIAARSARLKGIDTGQAWRQLTVELRAQAGST